MQLSDCFSPSGTDPVVAMAANIESESILKILTERIDGISVSLYFFF